MAAMERYIKAFPQLLVSEEEAHLTTVAHDNMTRYVPKTIVGYGAFATVIKLEKVGSKELACLKILESQEEAKHKSALHMLSREARLTNASSSFATMRITGIYEGLHIPPGKLASTGEPLTKDDKGGYYCGCLMEFFEGGTMNQEISARRRRKLSLGEAQAGFLFLQVALAVAEAHQNGVMHRDIKPSNIFMRASGLVCIADFGLASDNPVSTTLCGTPFYIAPEMWKGESYNAKVDVWSLGVVLYELLAFQRPFVPSDPLKRSNEDIKAVIVSGEAPPPLPDSVSEPFRTLVDQLLTHDPKARPTSAEFLRNPLCKALIVLFIRAVRVQSIPAEQEGKVIQMCLKYLRPIKTAPGASSNSRADSSGLSTSLDPTKPPIQQTQTTHRTAASVAFGSWYRARTVVDTVNGTLTIAPDDQDHQILSYPFQSIVTGFGSNYSTLTGNHDGIVVIVLESAVAVRVQFVSTDEAANFAATIERIVASQ